jgi:hypothetical protein
VIGTGFTGQVHIEMSCASARASPPFGINESACNGGEMGIPEVYGDYD